VTNKRKTMQDTDIPEHVPDYQLEQMDGEHLLYHPVKTLAMHLNETASMVWQLCDGRRDVKAIRELLVGAFPANAEQVAGDVATALQQFVDHDVIRVQ